VNETSYLLQDSLTILSSRAAKAELERQHDYRRSISGEKWIGVDKSASHQLSQNATTRTSGTRQTVVNI
jgi:hypothetical protein